MSENAADPLHVSSEGLPALNDAELSVLIEIGEAGGMWPRHKLDAAAVRALLDAALLWPKGHSAVASPSGSRMCSRSSPRQPSAGLVVTGHWQSSGRRMQRQ